MTQTPPTIPVDASAITTKWMTHVLAAAGLNHDLTAIRVAPIGTGQMATSLRVELDYVDRTDVDPGSVVVKLASSDPNSRAAGARGAYLREVRFYQELNHELSVATPHAIWADIDLETNAFAVVLEDMSPAQQGDQIAGCGVEQAMAAALNIAGLHAPRWCDESLFSLAWLTPPADQRDATIHETKAAVGLFLPGFLARYADRLTRHHVALLDWFGEHVDTWLGTPGHCFGLTHNDHRLDNLLFNGADSTRPISVVDWQTISVRNPVADISYLLGTGLDSGLRREVERDVVAAYHQRLLELGVVGYSLELCLEDYRSQTPHALLLTILGSMMTGQTDRGDDMFMAMLRRSSQQMQDLGVF